MSQQQPQARVLLVEDDRGARDATKALLQTRGYEVVAVSDGADALRQLSDGVTVILTDLKMPDINGLELLKTVRRSAAHIPVILVTGHGSEQAAVEALKSGAFHYLTKPVNPEVLLSLLEKAVERFSMAAELARLQRQLTERGEFARMIGKHPAMRKVFETIRIVADTRSTVLIVGESGTGKELVARALHEQSDRRRKDFVAVNCAAIPKTLVESELFGHVKGSFTGATASRSGKFQAADGGTLLIDEIGDMPMELQGKLLRVIESRAVSPVGSDSEVGVDVRIIASTHRDLQQLVDEGKFREDLYYRLNVVRIELPPLRERKSDIPLLIAAFIQQLSSQNHRAVKDITPQALARLQDYDWPGNVRELQNVIESITVMSTREVIDVPDLPPPIQATTPLPTMDSLIQRDMTMEEICREAIAQTLRRTGGNRSEASRILGVSVRTLQRKIKQYGFDV